MSAPVSSHRCSIDGCVIPLHAVVACKYAGCGALVCGEHAAMCALCDRTLCPSHLKTPICEGCVNVYALQYKRIYEKYVRVVTGHGDHPSIEAWTARKLDDEQPCGVAGCEIPRYAPEICTKLGCRTWVCGGHCRRCDVCDREDFCPEHVKAYACVDCVADYEFNRKRNYDRNAAVILREAHEEERRKTWKNRTVKRKATAPPTDEPASKAPRPDE